MRQLFLLFTVLVLGSEAHTQGNGAPLAGHVILITIDGFRPDFYLEPNWHTPNLRALMQDGFHAVGVNSVFPSMTYPSHTTIVTGVQPVKHGIYYNGMYGPNGPSGKIYWNNSQ